MYLVLFLSTTQATDQRCGVFCCMKKVIVTGGAGFIGSHIVDLLVKSNISVIIIDNLSHGKNINPKAEFYKIDISSEIKKWVKTTTGGFPCSTALKKPERKDLSMQMRSLSKNVGQLKIPYIKFHRKGARSTIKL